MSDQQSLDAAAQQIHQLRADALHREATVGRAIDQIMQELGWDLPKTLGYFHHIGRPLPVSPVMAELVLRLYQQAPAWADGADQVQVNPIPSELVELVELVEGQQLNDMAAHMGIPFTEDCQ
jgi:hypothetical protein